MEKIMDKECAFMATTHKGVSGAIHYYDVADGYGASVVLQGDKDAYMLEVPTKGVALAKNLEELHAQWVMLIDSFLSRHPEHTRAYA